VPAEPTKLPALQSAPKAVTTAKSSSATLSNWWSLAYQSYQGIETPEIRAWKRRNADATPQWMVKIAQDMPESTLPVMMLPGLVGRAGVELFYETVQLAGDVVKFNINEIERFTKGQETLTVKAIMLMSKFVGEEAARIAAKEDPASFAIAKNLALSFNHLEMEDQVKAGAKLVLSLFATPTGIARVAKVSGENAEKALQLVAQAEKVPALPAAPLRINPPRAAKNSLGELTATHHLDKSALSLTAWQNFKSLSPRATGARELSGAGYLRAEELAEKIYSEIRLNLTDVKLISKNTGLSEMRIERIKNHLFFNEHQLKFTKSRFDADPLIVEAWKRLETNKFTNKDIQLLNHELFESKFEGIFKADYLTSHNAANQAGFVSPLQGLNSKQLSEIYHGFLHRFGKN
jgi:hypothetical protein